jgi:isocitrate dehydrogenase kinase/phosphatase
MKYLIVRSFLMLILFITGHQAFAQPSAGNAVIVQNLERAFPENGTMAEFDSLTHLYNTKVWNKNPYVISHKTVRHWWGNDNRDVIEITEVKTWEDIPKAMAKNEELFMEAWSTKESRDAFNKAYDKYFTGKHSDEIYQEVTFSK